MAPNDPIPGCFVCNPKTMREMEAELGGVWGTLASADTTLHGIPIYVSDWVPDGLHPLPEDVGRAKPLIWRDRLADPYGEGLR